MVSGGKHYGHLRVAVRPRGAGRFDVRITPVYVFPVTDESGTVTGMERRVYDDEVTFSYEPDVATSAP